MSLNNDCTTCQSCEDTLKSLNYKISSISDKLLYNTRFELGRPVDKDLFRLLQFYKGVLEDICSDSDCGCYYTAVQECGQTEVVNTGIPGAVVNTCVCGCCPPLNVVCGYKPVDNNSEVLTKENIIERIKILIA